MKNLFFILFFLVVIAGMGQRKPTVFGQNRVQYENKKWKRFETNHFEIFFYKKGESLAKSVAFYAEKDYKRIAQTLGYYSYRKIKLIVYNSISDKEQSNIGLKVDKYNTGTETNYIKNKIEVSFNSTQAELKRQVTQKITDVLVYEMLYGNGMNKLIQSSYFVSLPQWFTMGLSKYVTDGWSVDMDNYMRVGRIPQGMSGINNLRNEEAAIVGQSIWNYIVEVYGVEGLRNIVTFTRLSRDEKLSITNTLGEDYKDFYNNYIKFYDKNSGLDGLDDISTLETVDSYRYKTNVYGQFKVSPDGNKIAYSTNEDGKIRVYMKDLQTGKSKKLFKQGIKNRTFEERENLPLLEWRNNEDLFIIYRGENEWSFFKDDQLVQISGNSLILRNLTGNGRRRYLKSYEQIQSLSFSQDGSQMLLSVIDEGQSDLLLYMPKINKTLKLTEDIYDDIDPIFLDEGKVIFASNRSLDNEGYTRGLQSEINNNFDIFLLEVFKKEDRITPLTTSLSREVNPYVADGKIYYVGNETGINTVYKYSLEDSSSLPIAQFQQNIRQINVLDNKLYITAAEGKGSAIFECAIEPNIELKSTVRQDIVSGRSSGEYPVFKDTIAVLPDKKQNITKPNPYDLSFGLSKVHSGIRIDPLLGFGTILDLSMTDLMENHKISGGIFVLSDFASSSLYTEYNYLKKRVDFGLKYERENYNFVDEINLLKFSSQKFRGTATFPFNYANSISLQTGWVQTRATFLDLTSIRREDLVTDFTDLNLTYVYDNTTKEGLNMLQGTRINISVDNMFGVRTTDTSLVANQENFHTLKADIRNYTEILNLFIWANRLTFGSSMGNAPKTFIFGGMDNWFGPKTDINETPPVNYTSDVLYLDYVTTVRGFNYNVRNGNNFVLLNSELRLPYKKLTSFSTYKSNLVENLQFTFFTDLGTAWSGLDPTSQENSINKSVKGGDGKPYTITAYNYRSPLVMGFGGGARTTLLGTYVKADLGWGIEDFKVSGPKFYLTLGYDF